MEPIVTTQALQVMYYFHDGDYCLRVAVFYLEQLEQTTKLIVHFYIYIYLSAAQQDVSTEDIGRFDGVFIQCSVSWILHSVS